jgi:hypothetical protein
MNKVVSYVAISKDKYLVSYIPKLDHDIINSHNLDFMKLLNKFKDKELRSFETTSIAISAAVTAYGRIYISKLKLYILSLGGKIYYSDTDSIITDLKLNDKMISSNELGKLELEHIVKIGIFIFF